MKYVITHFVLKDACLHFGGWVYLESDSYDVASVEVELVENQAKELISADFFIKNGSDFPEGGNIKSNYILFKCYSRIQIKSPALVNLHIKSKDNESILIFKTIDKDGVVKLKHSIDYLTLNFFRKIKFLIKIFNKKTAVNFISKIRAAFNFHEDEWKEKIINLYRLNRCPVVLVIDHNLGGGANSYCEQEISKYIEKSFSVIRFFFDAKSFAYIAHYQSKSTQILFSLNDLSELSELIGRHIIQEVFYNNMVSYPDPLKLLDVILSWKRKCNVRIILAMHDYFSACPSFFLLNAKGDYCHVPKPEVCDHCLSRQRDQLVKFTKIKDIRAWRECWGNLIRSADEVRFFSESSFDLYKTIYSDFLFKNSILIPHKSTFLNKFTNHYKKDGGLHIGVVGSITYPKGSDIIELLKDEIILNSSDVKITVVGQLFRKRLAPHIDQTGGYDRKNLPDLIFKNKINMIFFSSIWPETFSYVVDEMMSIGMPIVCFDVGAPAERLRNYSRGKVIPLTKNANEILMYLTDFHAVISDIESTSFFGKEA